MLPALAQSGEDAGSGDVAYFELKPSLVANLNGGPKYIRCDIQIMTQQADRVADIKLHAAALRHEIFLLFADQDGKTLMTAQGKEGLRKQILVALQGALKDKTGDALIDDLYFTGFYVQ
jgi:flagellar FliL protein